MVRFFSITLVASILTGLAASGCDKYFKQKHPSCLSVQEVLSRHPEYLPSKQPENPPNIIILLVDALRPDHLGCYGYDRPTSFFMDSLSRGGTLFSNAFVHSTMTHSSTACLFTGTIPPANGVHEWADASAPDMKTADKLQDQSVTIAEMLKRRGYHTAAFLANWHITPQVGYKQGFDEYKNKKNVRAGILNKMAVKWMESHTDKPFFCYIHYMDVHMPYKPPAPYNLIYIPDKGLVPGNNMPSPAVLKEKNLPYVIGQYDGQIHYLDDQLRIFWEMMRNRGLLENTLVVLTADHGEELMDHDGFGHAISLYDELLHVPLVFWFPGVIPAGVVREEMVMQTDIFPTLASFAGASCEGLPLYGTGLFSAADGSNSFKSGDLRILYAEVITYKNHVNIKALRTCEEKLIISKSRVHQPEKRYFDLINDPGEKINIYSPVYPRLDSLEALLSELEKGIPGEKVELDAEHIKELESLGYLE